MSSPRASLTALLWQNRPLLRAVLAVSLVPMILCWLFFAVTSGWQHEGQALVFIALASGLAAGCLFAGYFSGNRLEIGLAPLGGAGLVIFLSFTAGAHSFMEIRTGLLLWPGFCGGLILVPLGRYILHESSPGDRVRVLFAVIGLIALLLMGNLALIYFRTKAGTEAWSLPTHHLSLAALTFAMLVYGVWHIPHHTVCTVMRLIGPLFYRVKIRGGENIPPGGALIICNHLSYVDAVVLQLASPRPVRFIAFAGLAKSPFMRFVFRATGVIPVAPNKPTKGIRLAWDAIKAGELVCVFPEGSISRTGQLMKLRRGFGLIAEVAKVPVVPAVIDGLWGSVYSFAGNKYLWKSPRLKPTHVCVIFGPVIPPEQADLITARRALLDLGEQAFQERPVLKRHVARESIRMLAKTPRHVVVVDRTAARREVTAAQMIAVVGVLSRRLRATVPEKRVGIVLPPGAGAFIANLAISAAGKTPVNLNFTAGRASLEASLRVGEISTVLTAEAMKGKVPNFPFPERTLDLAKEIEAAGGKPAMLPWLLAAYLLPNQWVADLLRIPRTGDNAEAALLFTSGSSGEPKGVVLSHRNILTNCAQISSLSIFPETGIMLGCLPVFHSFGFTVTMWYPLMRGCRVVTVPSPLDTRKIVEAIHQEKATVMIGAPTFIRPFLKRATREELASLNLVVTGAEKLPSDLYDNFLSQFGTEILQGYGLTETTPVASINQYDPPITTTTAEPQEGKRPGSVGRMLPGMSARIVDPDTGAVLPETQIGLLWFRGPNVFGGYLKDQEKSASVMRDGWFVTGDLARFDEDGFLHIEGRLSRFSKIGGEMVPHGTVEQKLLELFGWDQLEGLNAVVVGVPDSSKGEALVLLTTQNVAVAEIRAKLTEAGLPNLWVPKIVARVESIPVLGTGKTDLKCCRELALEKARAEGA